MPVNPYSVFNVPNLHQETWEIVAACPNFVDDTSLYWIDAQLKIIKGSLSTAAQQAMYVTVLTAAARGGIVRWSQFGVSASASDNTAALNSLPGGCLIIADTPGTITFSSQWRWLSGQVFLFHPSIPIVSTGNLVISTQASPIHGIWAFSLNLTSNLISQPIILPSIDTAGFIGLTMQRSTGQLTTWGTLLQLVDANDAIVQIPAGIPDLIDVYDPTQPSGRFARRYTSLFELNQDPANTQTAWSLPINGVPNPPISLGNRQWKINTLGDLNQRNWTIGDPIALKSKHGGVDLIRIAGGQNLFIDNATFSISSRLVLQNINGVTLTNYTIPPVPGEMLCTNEGGPQFTNCTNVFVSGFTASNTGDDSIAFAANTQAFITNATISDSFARGILIFNTPNVTIGPNVNVIRCPILQLITLDITARQYINRMTVQPTLDQEAIYNAFVIAIKNGALSGSNILAKLDVIYLLQSHDQQAALLTVNLNSPVSAVVVPGSNGGPVFNQFVGYQGIGDGGILNTQHNPSTEGGLYTENSSCLFMWVVNSVNEAAAAGGQTNSRIVPNNGGTMLTRSQESSDSSDTVTDSVGFSMVNRTSSTSFDVYRGTTDAGLSKLSTHTVTATTMPTLMSMLGDNTTSSNAMLAVFGYGEALGDGNGAPGSGAEITDLFNAIVGFLGQLQPD